MSLINKMLQDLDARGTPDGRGDAGGIRSVPEREHGLPRALVFGGAAGLTAVAIALGWVYLKRPSVPPMLVNVASLAAPAPAPAPAPVVAVVPTPVTVPEPVAPVAVPEPAPVKDRPEELRRITAKPAKSAVAPLIKVAVPAAISEKIIEGKQVTPQQRVENEYRRALGYLQDGRVAEAMAGLQHTLQLDPRHQGARETLIRLLLEAQRPDDAVRQLQLSLGLDPKQPAQAMMLARLQLDKNASAALDTLMRSLPYAADNGEYRAFLAGVLQRQQRYHDAAEQYELALQGAPDNSVWWMGLGIALQADNHPDQARQAYERAKGLQTLSPQLQAFVERKLVQLTAPTTR
ncbi:MULTISPECIES: lipopolysaccharide assembly protein LapB [unclassified Janthinobacterium]|uniref:tetratricopeptide repeat protein n=1 Tax=unclassified Janthinobacterium TaxID=2610881 RepID=UPI00161032B7|nr:MULTISPECIES: tetratricopeptide repeat protein [unclassified Janthinobacterium]MBB5368633.1 MSHA biogenesis protein MshN [Janthinobacterium sp. K2C7]MBB5381831.1 MSHA biogenesis protein MshN [Janthinobacterium sp. K2Li3]MBB5387015.1 MSHA biogenesis protein MshN [Janthinobacterium sp. K2E3]